MAEAAFTLVTGATSGIGEGIAIALSAAHDLILHGREAGRLRAVLDRCQRREQHRIWNCDLSGTADVGRELDCYLANNRLRVRNFIHSAGVVKVAGIRQLTIADALALFHVNLFSAMAIAASLVRSDPGAGVLRSLVMISSAASQRGEKGAALYSASKGAIDALVKSLAAELAPAVRVNAVLPGLVRTRMAEATLTSPEFQDVVRRKYPLGVGEISDVVRAVEYLISESAKWVTGALWAVDGGRTAI
jgi:NAD(P)-dependent dehydrogenase (short-subunit alcohol dehydrogenase family)